MLKTLESYEKLKKEASKGLPPESELDENEMAIVESIVLSIEKRSSFVIFISSWLGAIITLAVTVCLYHMKTPAAYFLLPAILLAYFVDLIIASFKRR